MGNEPGQNFISRIESLRGLAALSVAVIHSFSIFDYPGNKYIFHLPVYKIQGAEALINRLIISVFNGSAGVIVFFVISGFVLGLSLDRAKGSSSYQSLLFYIRRGFRIMPAYIVSIFFISFFIYFIKPKTFISGSSWFNEFYQYKLTLHLLLKDLVLFTTRINIIAWTLQVELFASLIFPILYYVERKTNDITSLICLSMLILFGYFYSDKFLLKYIFIFYLGLMLSSNKGQISRMAASCLPFNYLFAIAAGLLLVPQAITGEQTFAVILAGSLGAALLLLLSVEHKNRLSLLDRKGVRALGEISYSFYLYHFIIMFIFARMALEHLPIDLMPGARLAIEFLIFLASIFITFYIARLSFIYIEKPGILIGKLLTDILCRKGSVVERAS